MNTQLRRLAISSLIAGVTNLGFNFDSIANSAPAFSEATTSAGILSTKEETFSVSWMDFNADGKPDLWITPHGYRSSDAPKGAKFPSLYLNRGSGTFNNIISQVWPIGITGDTHGSAWGDFDNDGDPDLFVVAGAEGGHEQAPNFFFVNNQGKLREQAVALGLDYPLGRGRSPLWFDFNKDRLLDVLQLNEKRPDGRAPTALFRQTATGFKDVSASVGLNINEPSDFAQLGDLVGNHNLDLLIPTHSHYPQKLYDTTTVPFSNLTNAFPTYENVSDAVIADFNGDLHSDVFLPRNKFSHVSSIFQTNENLALAHFVTNNREVGISFKTNGNVSFDFRTAPVAEVPIDIGRSNIFIGSQGLHPAKIGFSLSPNDPSVRGIKPHTPGADPEGLYIGYDPVNKTWKALASYSKYKELYVVIETAQPVFNMASIGFAPLNLSQNDLQDVLLLYNSQTNQYVDRTQGSGLGNPILAQSVVAGDFDNDMDVDLYLIRGYKTFDLPSVLLENRGNGTFVTVPNAGGAVRRNLGFHYNALATKFITGSRLAVADYNVDGFLDLFVSNGVFRATQKTYLGSPHQLFRNVGNNNHWIELDLKGVVSNRDGIGARVLLTAGGVTQLREQGGGMHLFSQNQQRIHFGLKNNTRIDKIEIQWPSGVVQQLFNVSADQVLRVVELNA
ncbi:MAG: CRTAC1 family protein [Gloeocapsa sp. UFS-A4-WI-NPMV-4B04]|jgi:hypothetical protein|nr:CRTAC1 family protein [Gloeocapsa sp. UFS-A4-WI-NPMV-4B04]